ncbi:MAG TPA: serine hydrolase domain-containing protein [Thermoanaerobaculia bacterium]|nr:serine hydrolase domain-containing protein [Thermoanaerobaculia bacterium]
MEKASGESWYDYVAHHVVQAAGMTGSGAFEGDREVPNLATGYTFWRSINEREAVFDPRERRNTTFISALRGNPAAGTYSTVRDLDCLVQAIERCRLVSCAARDAMFKQHVTKTAYAWSSVQQGYGYGVETRTIDGDELVGKSGDLAGASAQLSIDRRRGITIVVLSNYDAIAQPVAELIEDVVRRVQ